MFAVPVIVAVNIWRWLTARVEVKGVSESEAVLVSVTVALPMAIEFTVLVAWMVTVGGEGSESGAV